MRGLKLGNGNFWVSHQDEAEHSEVAEKAEPISVREFFSRRKKYQKKLANAMMPSKDWLQNVELLFRIIKK